MYGHVDPESRWGKSVILLGTPLFALFLYFQVLGFVRSWRSHSWPSVDGVVVRSATKKVWTQHGPHDEAQVRYAYRVHGSDFENDTVSFGLFRGTLSWNEARRRVALYPVGRPVEVFYNPANPAVSCLRKGGVGWEDLFMLVVCTGGLFYGGRELGNLIVWLQPRRRRIGSDS